MRNQHMIHLVLQEHNFGLKLAVWKNWLSLYFATNQFNYARYDSYYIEVLGNLETLYPGLKQLVQKTGLQCKHKKCIHPEYLLIRKENKQ